MQLLQIKNFAKSHNSFYRLVKRRDNLLYQDKKKTVPRGDKTISEALAKYK